jgi:hypothetical protein
MKSEYTSTRVIFVIAQKKKTSKYRNTPAHEYRSASLARTTGSESSDRNKRAFSYTTGKWVAYSRPADERQGRMFPRGENHKTAGVLLAISLLLRASKSFYSRKNVAFM